MNIENIHTHASSASDFLKAMGNPQRLMLLCTIMDAQLDLSFTSDGLADHEGKLAEDGVFVGLSVGELETLTGIQQPTLSQQLGCLRRSNLVATQKQGKQVFYRVADEDVLNILRVLYAKFCAYTNSGE